MTTPEHANGGAVGLAQSLGRVEQQLTAIVTEQVSQRDLLTRFDERQRGWATKHEVSEAVGGLRSELAVVANAAGKADDKALAAHNRVDGVTSSLAVLGQKVDDMSIKVEEIRDTQALQAAQVRGGAFVVGSVGKWVFGTAGAAVAAGLGYLIGHG